MKVIKFIVYFSISASIICCINQREKEIKNELGNFINSEIIIPEDLNTFYTVDSLCLERIKQADTKMIVYYDSVSCTPCSVSHLIDWKDIIIYMEKTKYRCLPIFIFTPSEGSKNELFELLEKMRQLEYYILIDENASFINQNRQLSQDIMLHTFLLDKNNKVVLAGSPLYNKKLWDLYKETIKELIENGGELKK